ncbi:MAG TPA: hypothetical protein VNS12_10390 [Pelagibacterium sp.]|uniref:hypothetical protein n=1 Tax=Pelagibacterium sp. TaxID=1967288 RepID=UPI002C59673A|nr:hypothetical protein [Pelagibacterium sp.]HWJ88468.1 hypothetical protein [Pelagibacterium sp.]
MTAVLAKLSRAIDELERALAGSRHTPADRLRLKAELETHIQRIDELRQRL